MNDELIATKFTEHDRHLDTLSNAVQTLAKTTEKTNDKLDSVVDVMSKQNVLIEKMSNLGRSLDTVRDTTRAMEAIVNKYPDVEEIKNSIKITEGLPSTTTIRWAVGILLTYLAVSGNYIIGHIHVLESELATSKKVDELVTSDFSVRISKLESKHENDTR